MVRNSERTSIPEPATLERVLGFLTIAALFFDVGSFFFGGEFVGETQELLSVPATIFFGEMWLHVRSRRLGIKKEEHPLHPILAGARAATRRAR